MKTRVTAGLASLLYGLLGAGVLGQELPPSGAPGSQLVSRASRPLMGDLAEMSKRRLVRVLVSHSRTNFFVQQGNPRGFEYELLCEYKKFLNQGRPRKDLPIDVVFVPVLFKELMPALIEGRGDIAAAGLTVTPSRARQVAFTDPYIENVDEIVVTHEAVDGIESLDALAGRTVYVSRDSSYAQHLVAVREELVQRGLEPLEVVCPGDQLETEDILEMISAGIVDLTVADRHIAELWAPVLTDLRLHPDVPINVGGRIAWAVRKDSPELLASLNRFVKQHRKGTLLGNILFRRYYGNTKWITNPTSDNEREKLKQYVALFQKYADQYGFDWLLIAAQAYQESGLDQSIRSKAGAVGIMQVMPKTGEGLKVGDVTKVENNIHAGVKYMRQLQDQYFNEKQLDPAVRFDFTLAAYNAGPNRVQKWRNAAAGRGLDPNRWFQNVERVALESVGPETVRYVGNINKYYIAYKMIYRIEVEKSRS